MPATYTPTPASVYARHIAGKIAADLKRLQRLMGKNAPDEEQIDNLQLEAAVLLKHECLAEAIYGFKRDGKWTCAIKYSVINGEIAESAEAPADARPFMADGGFFASLLTYSPRWHSLDSREKQQIADRLPVARAPGSGIEIESGCWGDDRLLPGDLGVQRTMTERYRSVNARQ